MQPYSIKKIHALYLNGTLTAEQLVKQYLERIEQYDRGSFGIKSIIELNPDAIIVARQLDEYYQKNGFKGALHGIPVLVKDNIDTADRMMTTAGSLALLDNYAAQDASVIHNIRQAGAIILGKTNLSEWANFRGKNSTSGWSSHGGQTLNPYDRQRSPGGSSSGSAAAIAANFATVAIGTETDGSIICPTSECGVIGLKPPIDWLSNRGIIPIGHSQDTAGAIARSVEDAAILLNAMAGKERVGNQKTTSTIKEPIDWNCHALSGAKIAVLTKLDNYKAETITLFKKQLTLLKASGAILVESELKLPEEVSKAEGTVLEYEFKYGINRYLDAMPAAVKVHSLNELIAYNREHANSILKYHGQERLIAANQTDGLKSEVYLKAQATCHKFREYMEQVITEQQFDAIIAPTRDVASLINHSQGDTNRSGCNSLAAVSGGCNISVPMGYIDRLPVGISFFSSASQFDKILQLAHAYEAIAITRQAPDLISA